MKPELEPLYPRLISVREVKPGDRIALDLGRIRTVRHDRSSIMLYQENQSHNNYGDDQMVILLDRAGVSLPGDTKP